MAWTNPISWAVGQLVTAANMNTIRDNLNELWKGTTAGDLDYYSSATAKTRIPIGAEDRMTLRTIAGVPTWEKYVGAKISKAGSQSISTASSTQITGMAVNTYDVDPLYMATGDSALVIPNRCSGFFMIGGGGYWDGNATGKLRQVGIEIHHSSSAVIETIWQSSVNDTDSQATHQSITISYPLWAGYYVRLVVLQRSGGNLNFNNPYLWVARVA